jgi:hypothetical protein
LKLDDQGTRAVVVLQSTLTKIGETHVSGSHFMTACDGSKRRRC